MDGIRGLGVEAGDDTEKEKEMDVEKRIERAFDLLVRVSERGGAKLPEEVTRDVLRGVILGKGKGKGEMSRVGERVLLACEMLEWREERRRVEEKRDRAYAELEDGRRELEDAQREMREIDQERRELEAEVERKRKMLFLMGVLEKREGVRMERVKAYAGLVGDLRKQVGEKMRELERVVDGKREEVKWDEETVRKRMEKLARFESTRDILAKLHAAHVRGDWEVGDGEDIGENELERLREEVEEREEQLSGRIARAAGLAWVCGEQMDWLTTFRTETAPALDGILSAEGERLSGYVGRLSAAIQERQEKKKEDAGFVSEVRAVVGGGMEEVERMLAALETATDRGALGEVEEMRGVVMSSSVERNRALLARKQAKIAYGLSLAAAVRTMLEDSRRVLR